MGKDPHTLYNNNLLCAYHFEDNQFMNVVSNTNNFRVDVAWTDENVPKLSNASNIKQKKIHIKLN